MSKIFIVIFNYGIDFIQTIWEISKIVSKNKKTVNITLKDNVTF